MINRCLIEELMPSLVSQSYDSATPTKGGGISGPHIQYIVISIGLEQCIGLPRVAGSVVPVQCIGIPRGGGINGSCTVYMPTKGCRY